MTLFTHPDPHAAGVDCHICRVLPASHKVAEVTEDARHEFTSYVCCHCFATIMGSVAASWCARAKSK